MKHTHDKIAIVTGASRGIGLSIAFELASMGYWLGISSRTESDIKAASELILKKYPEIKIIAGAFDLSDSGKAKEFAEQVSKEFGFVSVLINNAGQYISGTSELPSDKLEDMMNINFKSAAYLSQSVIPGMKKNKIGYIINISSICGVEAFQDVGGYVASKFALTGYSDSLAQELEPYGIKVTAICPGWVNTRMSENSRLKPEEMIQPEDIAKSVRYLLEIGKTAFIRKIVINSK